jgi:phage-related protein
MANVLGLALKISADASQLKLTPAERAIQAIEREAKKATAAFDAFASSSEAAAVAQRDAVQSFSDLSKQLQSNQISAAQFSQEFSNLGAAVEAQADAFARAAEITESVVTPAEKFARRVAELDEQLQAGRITTETYGRAVAEVRREYGGLDANLSRVEERAGKIANIFGRVGDTFRSVSGAAEGVGNAVRAISEAGSAVVQFGFDVAKATAAFKAFQFATQNYSVPQGLLGIVLNLGKFLTILKVAEVAASQLGVDISGVADAATKASLVFAGFKVGGLLGLDKALAPTIATLGTALPAALARVGVPLAASNAAGAALSATFVRLLGFSIPGFGQLAAAVYTGVKAFSSARDRAFDLAEQLREGTVTADQLNEQFGPRITANVESLASAITRVEEAQSGLSGAAQSLSDTFVTPFLGAFARLQDGYASLIDGISPVVSGIADVIRPFAAAFEPVFTAVGSIVEFFGRLVSSIGSVVGSLLSFTGALVGLPLKTTAASLSVVSDAFSVLLDGINLAIDIALTPLRSAMGALTDLVNAAGDSYAAFVAPVNLVQGALASVGALVADQLLPAFRFFSESADRASRIVVAAFEKVREFFKVFTEVFVVLIGENVSAFLEFTGIGDVVVAVADRIGQAFNSAWELVQGVAGTVGGLIERVLAFAEDWLGISRTIQEPVVATFEVDTGDAIAELIAENKDLGKVIDGITKSVSDAINKSAQFGQAGFDAALRYQQGIDDLKDKLARGFFNEEQFRIEAEKARVAFQGELDRISQDAQLDIQINENAARTLEGLRSQINDVVGDSARLGQAGFDAALQYQSAIERLQKQFEQGVFNETTLAAEAKKAREEYDLQVKSIEAAVAAQQQQIDNDRKRIESLLQVNDAASRITDDIAAVDREISRVQEELARAEGELNVASAEAARRRIDELEQLQSRLADDLQAASQGFEQGFDKAFAATGANFARLAEQAAQFGEAGNAAAARLQEGIAAAQEQARDGILNREAFEAEVARRQQLFEQEIEQVKAVADERKRVNDFVDQQGLLARFGGDQQRLAAAQRVAEIEREIIRVQGEVQAARAAGNQEAVNAGIQRLGLLDQVGARERDIASGRQQLEQQIAQQRDQYLQQLSQQQEQARQQQAAFIAEQQKVIEAEQQRQVARVRELNTLGAGVIGGADLRTSEGAAQFLQLAASRQDPALIEARLQTRRLLEIRNGVLELIRSFGLPIVQIGAGVG